LIFPTRLNSGEKVPQAKLKLDTPRLLRQSGFFEGWTNKFLTFEIASLYSGRVFIEILKFRIGFIWT